MARLKRFLRAGEFPDAVRRYLLMVMLFDHRAHRGHRGEHFAAHVLRGIDRRNREVTTFGAHAVAKIAALVRGALDPL